MIKIEKLEAGKVILHPEESSVILFSRLSEPVELTLNDVGKLQWVFTGIIEEIEGLEPELDEYSEEQEILLEFFDEIALGFEEEFASRYLNEYENNKKEDYKDGKLGIKVVELENLLEKAEEDYTYESVLAFNSFNKRIVLTPSNLKTIKEHLTWAIASLDLNAGTVSMIKDKLIKNIELELKLIEENAPHNNLFVGTV